MALMLKQVQDAQKGQTSHPPNPGAPRRALSQARPQRAKRRGGTDRTSCGRSPYNGSWRTENPLQCFRPPKILFNVEPLSDARTPHGKRRVSARRGRAGEKSDFFSILLDELDAKWALDKFDFVAVRGINENEAAAGRCPRRAVCDLDSLGIE